MIGQIFSGFNFGDNLIDTVLENWVSCVLAHGVLNEVFIKGSDGGKDSNQRVRDILLLIGLESMIELADGMEDGLLRLMKDAKVLVLDHGNR